MEPFGANLVSAGVFRGLNLTGREINADLIGETKLRQETEDFTAAFVQNASQNLAGRKGPIAQESGAQSQLLTNLKDPTKFNKHAPRQAPFDEILKEEQSLSAVLEGIEPSQYSVGQRVIDNAQRMIP